MFYFKHILIDDYNIGLKIESSKPGQKCGGKIIDKKKK